MWVCSLVLCVRACVFVRLFMVHEDGSGTELLHVQAVEEVLDQAYSDPTIALLEEPLPDLEGTPTRAHTHSHVTLCAGL